MKDGRRPFHPTRCQPPVVWSRRGRQVGRSAELECLRLASRQHGVISRTQAREHGLSNRSVTRRVASGRWRVDLAATEDPQTLRANVDEALRRRWTTLDRLEVALARSASQAGAAALRALVRQLLGGEAPTESELEARVAELLEDAGFPRPVRQRVVRVQGGVRRMDFLIPGTSVVIEAEG